MPQLSKLMLESTKKDLLLFYNLKKLFFITSELY